MAGESSNNLTLALTGDSMITRRVVPTRDPRARAVIEHIRSADIAFTNFESLPNDFRGDPSAQSGGTHMAAHGWTIDEIADMGFDLVGAATNHALDYSVAGLLAAMENFQQRGMPYAGVGRNMAEARMPVYVDSPAGSVGMVACCSTFARGQEAAEQRPEIQGRPGLNPLRYSTTHEITADQMETLRQIAAALGVEQQRQERIALGFAHPPDDPDIFPFFDVNFRVAGQPAMRREPNQADVDAIATWVREAKMRADIAILSLHAHEQGKTKEDPADFIITFARRMIEAGADMVVGHGPHLLRGMEIHQGRPIFYSLGNFIAQNDLVYKLPADAYTRFRVDPSKTPAEIARTRSRNDTAGFPADPRYWESLMPICRYQDGQLTEIELLPLDLLHGQPSHVRGRPHLAEGNHATAILERFAELCEPFGAEFAIDGERATVKL